MNWKSDNYIKFNAAPVVPTETFNGSQTTSVFGTDVTLLAYGYNDTGEVIETGTKTFSITTAAELAEFNSWLLGESDDAAQKPDGQIVSQIQLWLDAENSQITTVSAAQAKYAELIENVLSSGKNLTLSPGL